MSGWEWKDKSGATGGLLYEPGNWGDLLKGEWLLRVLRFLTGDRADGLASRPFVYVDICAGLPAYPAGRPCAARLRGLPASFMVAQAAREAVEGGRWPGAAVLAREFLRQSGAAAAVTVCDRDPARRAEWAAMPGVRLAPAEDGYALLPAAGADLVLADPYDFLAEWPERLEGVLRGAAVAPLLLYVYNRSGRGPERLREYKRFRGKLRDAGVPVLAGRAAADAFLPACWHEMFFLPGPAAARTGYAQLREELAQATHGLDAVIRAAGVFEED